MSPYEFMSKTHSLSTEGLGKFFIVAMQSWRGCIQGSGSMSRDRNQLKDSQKIGNKYPKNKTDILCCHDIEVAVLIVQGPYLNIKQSNKNG